MLNNRQRTLLSPRWYHVAWRLRHRHSGPGYVGYGYVKWRVIERVNNIRITAAMTGDEYVNYCFTVN